MKKESEGGGDALRFKGTFSSLVGTLIGGFLFMTQCTQFAKLGVFWKIRSKDPNLFLIGCFLRRIGIVMRHKIMFFEVLRWSKFLTLL